MRSDHNKEFFINNPFVPGSMEKPVPKDKFLFSEQACDALNKISLSIDNFFIEQQKYSNEASRLCKSAATISQVTFQILSNDNERRVFTPLLKNIISSFAAIAEQGNTNIKMQTIKTYSEISEFINNLHDSITNPNSNETFKNIMIEYALIIARLQKLENLGLEEKELAGFVSLHENYVLFADTMLLLLNKFDDSRDKDYVLNTDALRHKIDEIKSRLLLIPVLLEEIKSNLIQVDKYIPDYQKFDIKEISKQTELTKFCVSNALASILQAQCRMQVPVRKNKFITTMQEKIKSACYNNIQLNLISSADHLYHDILSQLANVNTRQINTLDTLKSDLKKTHETADENLENKLLMMKASIQHAWSGLNDIAPKDGLTITVGNFIDEMDKYSAQQNIINNEPAADLYNSVLPGIKQRLAEFNQNGANLSKKLITLPQSLEEKLVKAETDGKLTEEQLTIFREFFKNIIDSAVKILKLPDPFPEITYMLNQERFNYDEMDYCFRVLRDRIIKPDFNSDFKTRAIQCVLFTLVYKKIMKECPIDVTDLDNELIVPMQRLTKLGLFADEVLKQMMHMQVNDPDSEQFAIQIDQTIDNVLDLQCRAKMIGKTTNLMVSVIDAAMIYLPDYALFNNAELDEITQSIVTMMVTFIMQYEFESEEEFALKVDEKFSIYSQHVNKDMIAPCDHLIHDFMLKLDEATLKMKPAQVEQLKQLKEKLNAIHEDASYSNKEKIVNMWMLIEGVRANLEANRGLFTTSLQTALTEFLKRKSGDYSCYRNVEMDAVVSRNNSVKK